MSRSTRFFTGLLSSYAAIGVNTLYSLAAIPLALHYLGKEEYGVFILVSQLAGYLLLLEFGMTGSVARSLADHKDQMDDGVYGSILRTGGRVFAIQGGAVALMGAGLAWAAPCLLTISPNLQQPFAWLMMAQALLGGIKLAAGSLAAPLWCHQRLDLNNLSSITNLVINFGVLWIGLHLGWWLYSLSIATAAGALASLVVTYVSCRRCGYYPPRKFRGVYDPKLFRELFHFGGGLFLMNLGTQLTSASQVIVISRVLGTATAADWSVATKIFGMAQPFVTLVMDSSAGGLAEMFVRGQFDTLQKRFRDIVSISAVMATFTCAGIALANGPFIELWTSGRVSWAPWNNFLLACLLFCTTVTRCHTGLVGITKELRAMKIIYLLEGVIFVTLSMVLCRWFGLTGVLVAALACNLVVTGSYAISRSAQHFGISCTAVLGWIARPAVILALSGALFIVSQLSPIAGLSATVRFGLGVTASLFIVAPAIWLVGIPSGLRADISGMITRITGKAKAVLRIV